MDSAVANVCCVAAMAACMLVIHHSFLSHIMSLQDAAIEPRGERCPTSAGIV